jgi:putative alpha-1,2-mannosidase
VAGIPGNDDVGQMSAGYVLSALGLYQVCPGDNTFIIGSPLHASATLSVEQASGKDVSFEIRARNAGPANCYIRSARLNGRALDRSWLTYAEIAAGGVLELTMSPAPNKAWATNPRNRPPSMSVRRNA